MVGRQNNSADGEAGMSLKKFRRADVGQSIELRMLMRRPSLC